MLGSEDYAGGGGGDDDADVPLQSAQLSAADDPPPEQNDGTMVSGRRTAEWYRARANFDLYSGAKLTVMRAAYLFLSLKQQFTMRCNETDVVLRLLADSLLPDGNLMVPSLHLLKAVTGCVRLRRLSDAAFYCTVLSLASCASLYTVSVVSQTAVYAYLKHCWHLKDWQHCYCSTQGPQGAHA